VSKKGVAAGDLEGTRVIRTGSGVIVQRDADPGSGLGDKG